MALSAEDRERLIQAALQAKRFAYSPYSKFHVGAAFLTKDGSIVKGANVENASYGGTICAERTAIVKAVVSVHPVSLARLSEGIKQFTGLAVVSDATKPTSPCGICRQVIREFCAQEMPILLVPSDYPQPDDGGKGKDPRIGKGGVLETTLAELLPYSFGPEDLEPPQKE